MQRLSVCNIAFAIAALAHVAVLEEAARHGVFDEAGRLHETSETDGRAEVARVARLNELCHQVASNERVFALALLALCLCVRVSVSINLALVLRSVSVLA
jgi:hypothetical protein